MSSSGTMDQARFIFGTIRMMHARLAARRSPHCAGTERCHDILELTPPQMHTLMALRSQGQMTMKELAETMGVSASSTSAMVDRLVEMGAVEREHSQVDRREVVVRVTEIGDHTIEVMEHHLLDSLVDLLDRIGPDYAQQWCDVYAQVRKALDPEPGHVATATGKAE